VPEGAENNENPAQNSVNEKRSDILSTLRNLLRKTISIMAIATPTKAPEKDDTRKHSAHGTANRQTVKHSQ
jgi:hypothetical protein